MQISFSNINFLGRPDNYAVIDNYLSRSAQPQKEDFVWLKDKGITDIINFRTLYKPDINFDEEEVVKKAGIKYHNIPSITRKPTKENVDKFLDLVESIKRQGGKAHIHCKAGADRTGMYAFIYKMLNNIGDLHQNQAEWNLHGYHKSIYPDLMRWATDLVAKMRK